MGRALGRSAAGDPVAVRGAAVVGARHALAVSLRQGLKTLAPQPFFVLALLRPVSCLLSPASCLLSVSCLLSPVPCLLRSVSCLLSAVSERPTSYLLPPT